MKAAGKALGKLEQTILRGWAAPHGQRSVGGLGGRALK